MMRRWRLSCSFCGRSAAQVDKLVAGRRAYICDRCARETIRIMEQSGEPPPPVAPVPLWQRIWQRYVEFGERRSSHRFEARFDER